MERSEIGAAYPLRRLSPGAILASIGIGLWVAGGILYFVLPLFFK